MTELAQAPLIIAVVALLIIILIMRKQLNRLKMQDLILQSNVKNLIKDSELHDLHFREQAKRNGYEDSKRDGKRYNDGEDDNKETEYHKDIELNDNENDEINNDSKKRERSVKYYSNFSPKAESEVKVNLDRFDNIINNQIREIKESISKKTDHGKDDD